MTRNYNVLPSELTLRATTSGTVQLQLRQGTVGFDLSTVGTVQLHVRDKASGTVVYSTADVSPKLSVVGTAAGSINWVPGSANLLSGSAPYHAYFKLLRSASSWEFCPEDAELTIDVREVF